MNINYALIDLHLHIDGSIPIKTIIKCAKIENIDLPSYNENELIKYLSVQGKCENLNKYLSYFDFPNRVMQSSTTLTLCTKELVESLASQGLLYAELRIAPQFHTKKGLSQEQVTASIIKGIKEGMENTNIKVNLILCIMRGSNQEDNIKTLGTAKKFLKKGVVAIDLAGDEALYPNKRYKFFFEIASKLSIPFTIHSGEAAGAESIIYAIKIGAKRIGHGVRSLESKDLLIKEKEENTTLELCPTSNLQTRAISCIEDFPIKRLMEKGIKCTVNTDNMTVSNTTLKKEFEILFNANQLNDTTAKKVVLNAVDAAFLSAEEKTILRTKIMDKLNM